VLDPEFIIEGLADSKKITAAKRTTLATAIFKHALSWSIGRAEPGEIDRYNILQASLLAMARAYTTLSVKPDYALVDGLYYPDIACPGEAMVQGDARVSAISAASIIAKVYRDAEMHSLEQIFPGYEFARHKGYPTAIHLQKLHLMGITELHRKTFAPVRKYLFHES